MIDCQYSCHFFDIPLISYEYLSKFLLHLSISTLIHFILIYFVPKSATNLGTWRYLQEVQGLTFICMKKTEKNKHTFVSLQNKYWNFLLEYLPLYKNVSAYHIGERHMSALAFRSIIDCLDTRFEIILEDWAVIKS